MKPTTTDLITDLDALTHELRRVGYPLSQCASRHP